MALVNDYYDITAIVDGKELKEPSASYQITLHDSIYDLYNRGLLTIPDDMGTGNEFLLYTEGTPIEINMGLQDQDLLKSKFVIFKSEQEESTSEQTMGGPFRSDLINNWYLDQDQDTIAYQNTISKVIEELIPSNIFNKVEIDATKNFNNWYRALMTEGEFIQKVLRNYAISDNSENTPFYAFINSNNEFNFKSYYSMFSENIVTTLKYTPENSQSTDVNTIQYMKPYYPGSPVTRPFKKRKIFSYDEQGELQSEDNTILDYYPSQGVLQLRANQNSYTGWDDLGEIEAEDGVNESNEGRVISKLRESMNVAKWLIITPFNPKLLAGKTIKIELYVYAGGDVPDTLSHINSTNWLIETCDHVWDGSKQQGLTRIVVGRKYSSISKDYYLRNKMFKG